MDDIRVAAPWGPYIASGKLSEDLLHDINEEFDRLIKEDQNDHSSNLAGALDVQKLSDDESITERFKEEISGVLNALATIACNGSEVEYNWDCERVWYNQYYSPTDYNPLHMHPSDFGCVAFINDFEANPLPEKLTRSTRHKKDIHPGACIFAEAPKTIFSVPIYPVIPERGRVLVFPATLMHMVYPADYSTPRRTVATNLTCEILRYGDRYYPAHPDYENPNK